MNFRDACKMQSCFVLKLFDGHHVTFYMTLRDISVFRPPDSGASVNTPYSTMSRGMESHGYDDNTLSSGRHMNKAYQPANGGYHSMVQGHSNPAMNVEGIYITS